MIDGPSKGADRRGALLAWGAALVTVVLWASAFVGIRAAGEDLSPGALSLARLLVGSAALGALVLIRRERLPARRDLPAIALCGVLWFGLYNVVLNAAERLVDAGTAAMLVGIGPVFVAVFAGVLLGEGFPRSLFAGCAVAFAGVVVIGLVTSGRGLEGGLGAVLCLVAALAYAGGVVAQKPVLARLGFAGDVARVRRWGDRLPAIRPDAVARAGRGRRPGHRLGRLPRRVPDGRGLHDVGVRAR